MSRSQLVSRTIVLAWLGVCANALGQPASQPAPATRPVPIFEAETGLEGRLPIVPLTIEGKSGSTQVEKILVEDAVTPFQVKVVGRPRSVQLNAGQEVLALDVVVRPE